MDNRKIGLLSSNIDYTTIFIYVVLVFMGWVSIYSAVYDEAQTVFFDFSHRYIMQMVWIGISFSVAFAILLIDSKYYHILSYQIYWMALLLMVWVLFFGREVNGAKSWVGLGPIGIQPVEFMKIATALALAKFMSSFNFNIKHVKSLYIVGAIIFAPILLILLQNDTGSALVFSAFFIVLYREGFGAALYLISGYFVLLAMLSFFFTTEAMIVIVFVSTIIITLFSNYKKEKGLSYLHILRYAALVVLLFIIVELFLVIVGDGSDVLFSMVCTVGLTIPLVVAYVVKGGTISAFNALALFVAGIVLVMVVDYAFDNILQAHQRIRILDMLGIENDPRNSGYNALQSRIAIGSGGVLGRGFLQGTQTRFSFVPEQSTDFIFCTVGEEWGFVGSITVVLLFALLIYRLMRMGERQKEPFARIYCYSVTFIILLHFIINIMMTIGLFPIIGIPLPFFSYGGSSFLAFTIMLFIAIRLDSSQWEGAGR